MSTPHFLWRLICYRPWRYLAYVGVGLSLFMGRFVFGFIIQGFFNDLTLQKHINPTLWM